MQKNLFCPELLVQSKVLTNCLNSQLMSTWAWSKHSNHPKFSAMHSRGLGDHPLRPFNVRKRQCRCPEIQPHLCSYFEKSSPLHLLQRQCHWLINCQVESEGSFTITYGFLNSFSSSSSHAYSFLVLNSFLIKKKKN